ncbi:hypothetical protein MBLNU457_2047t1 [Dothideomycetes sp. NU457]
MKSFIAAAALSLISMAASSPVAMPDAPIGPPYWVNNEQVIHWNAKFDDETAGVDGLPVANPESLGPYDNAFYGSWSVISQGELGVKAFSAPNFIVANSAEEQDGTANIRADYDDSITDHLGFNYMYFGCVLASQETLAGVAVQCDIKVTGYRNQQQVTSQIFSFTPGVSLGVDMQKAVFNSGFQNVDRIEVAVTDNAIVAATKAILVDNIDYFAFLKQGYSYSG